MICLGLAMFSVMPLAHAEVQVPIENGNTQVRFECSSGLMPMAGRFEGVRGRIVFADELSTPRAVEVTIGSDSLTTGQAMIDRQLKGPDFFDSANYPAIVFESTDVIGIGADQAQASGRLTVKDITRPLTLQVALDPQTLATPSRLGREAVPPSRRAIRASADIRRSDFGMAGFNPLISDECSIQIRVALPVWVLND
jgi:polyisoprenoid-binding protein YceI